MSRNTVALPIYVGFLIAVTAEQCRIVSHQKPMRGVTPEGVRCSMSGGCTPETVCFFASRIEMKVQGQPTLSPQNNTTQVQFSRFLNEKIELFLEAEIHSQSIASYRK